MVKKSKLLAALDAHKGRDFEAEKQKKLRKLARRKQSSKEKTNGVESKQVNGLEPTEDGEHSEGWESDRSEKGPTVPVDVIHEDKNSNGLINNSDNTVAVGKKEKNLTTRLKSTPAQSSASPPPQGSLPDRGDTPSSQASTPSDIALSDLSSQPSAASDLIPHQRLTINNTSALLRAHASIAIPTNLPFSTTQVHISSTQIDIPDVNDDLKRELAFYAQCLEAANEGRRLLLKEGVPFTRPNDYFAEMVKTDEHMGKIKAKLTEEAAGKKAAAEARKLRDAKKFGKQVQVAKLQERDKARRETLDKIKVLKRKRKDTDTGAATEEDLFDVALEDADKADKSARGGRRDSKGGREGKRQKKDAKFGFGGKKRFAKSGDAISSGDMRDFSAKKMKGRVAGGGSKGPSKRLGKSRRAKN